MCDLKEISNLSMHLSCLIFFPFTFFLFLTSQILQAEYCVSNLLTTEDEIGK